MTSSSLTKGIALGAAILVSMGTPTAASAADGTHTDSRYCISVIETGETACADNLGEFAEVKRSLLKGRASTHLATLYETANFGGDQQQLFGNGCDDDSGSEDGFELDGGWNDRISSFQGFGECQVTLFENSGFTGASYGPYRSSSYVGDAMNDEASSVRVY